MATPPRINRIPNAGEIQIAAASAKRLRARLRELRKARDAGLKNARQQAAESADNSLPADVRQQVADAAYKRRAAAIRTLFDQEVAGMSRELGAVQQVVEAGHNHWTNKVGLLNTSTAASSERAVYTQTIATLGDAALRDLATDALANDNAPLAAALIARVGDMPASKRPFAHRDLVEGVELKGPTGEAAKLYAELADDAAAAEEERRLYERGGNDPLTTVRRGLRQRVDETTSDPIPPQGADDDDSAE